MLIYLIWFLFFNINQPSTAVEKPKQQTLVTKDIHKLYPRTVDEGQIIEHKAYSLMYNEKNEQPEWVIYYLTKKNVESKKKYKRSETFYEDKAVTTGSALPKDYKKSGYDKGHLCPAADMNWDKQAMLETFYMSNMSPQLPGFNRGIWKELEEQTREWAVENDSLIIITGPVLEKNLKQIGQNEVSVPKYYYKIITDISYPEYKSIAFVLKNEASDKDIFTYAVSIDSVESLTKIDFFPNNKAFEKMEHTIDVTLWKK
jgi:endonuclease G